jgi:ubiquinone/menaquinone biosynthesis C-methylase UbiE
MNKKEVLDVCCGSRMFWFDKSDKRALFCDKRSESYTLCDGRSLEIKPDVVCDFSDLPFDSNSFSLVVFDPPHLSNVGAESWMAKKYGKLFPDWRDSIRCGFSECFRVLKKGGVLIFKWNETQIKTSEILNLTEEKPLFGHISGKNSKTIWISFIK